MEGLFAARVLKEEGGVAVLVQPKTSIKIVTRIIRIGLSILNIVIAKYRDSYKSDCGGVGDLAYTSCTVEWDQT